MEKDQAQMDSLKHHDNIIDLSTIDTITRIQKAWAEGRFVTDEGKPIKFHKKMAFRIWIIDSQKYPKKAVRWEKYGKPLTSLFNSCFDEVAVKYYKWKKNIFTTHMDRIDVVCYKGKDVKDWKKKSARIVKKMDEILKKYNHVIITAYIPKGKKISSSEKN